MFLYAIVIVSSDRHTHSMFCGLIITILMRGLCVIVCLLAFTTLVKSVFLLCGAFLSNSICFVVYNRLSRCLVARLSHGSKVLCLSRTFLVCRKWKRPNEELFVGGGVAKTSKYSGVPHLKNTEIVLELLWVRKYHISSNWFMRKLYLDSLIFLAYVINV